MSAGTTDGFESPCIKIVIHTRNDAVVPQSRKVAPA
jgi:hypothetical protein